MFTKPKQKQPSLKRANPVESFFQNDIVIRISITTAIVLAFILFIAICFIVVPPTQGFFWW